MSHVVTKDSYRYFVYIHLKTRSDVLNVFQTFYDEVKTQFGKSINILYIDSALEYINFEFQSLCNSRGIIH